jgi:hypothetical protein
MKNMLVSGMVLFSMLLVLFTGATFADNAPLSQEQINANQSANVTNATKIIQPTTSTLSSDMKKLKGSTISVNLTKLNSPITFKKQNNVGTSTLSTKMKNLKSSVVSVNLTKLNSPITFKKQNNVGTSTLSTKMKNLKSSVLSVDLTKIK